VPLVNARLMASLIPRSRVRVLEDGHLFLFSRGVESAAAVNSFLTDDSSEKSHQHSSERGRGG
jgi:hypothetical protein